MSKNNYTIGNMNSIETSSRDSKLEKQIKRDAIVAGAAAIVSSTVDIEEVLFLLTQEMGKSIDATSAYLLTYDWNTKQSQEVAEYYGPDALEIEKVSDLNLVFDHTVDSLSEVNRLEQGEPSSDHFDDEGLLEYRQKEMLDYGAKSILTIPVQIKQKTIAYVEIWESRRKRIFTSDEIEICMAIAQQSTKAIEITRLLSETERQLQEQISLRRATLAISSTLELERVLAGIAAQVCKIVNGTSAYINDWNDDEKKGTVIAEYFSERATAKERVSDLNSTYPESAAEFIDTLLNGQHSVININDDISEVTKMELESYDGKTILYIPLLVKGKLIAFAEVWNSDYERQFTEKEISLVSDLASLAGVAIQNSRLYKQTLEEVKERKIIEDALRHSAYHDELTGLPNRALLMDRLKQVIAENRRRPHQTYALLFLDLDRFKIVNDSLGHHAGDELLVSVSSKLKRVLREEDMISRLGGDEFVILLPNIQKPVDAIRVASKCINNLDASIDLEMATVHTSVSIGIVIGNSRYQKPGELLRDADTAMYRAKEKGKNQFVIFDQDMHIAASDALKKETDLRGAINNDELFLVFQPIISLEDSNILGVEALVRWMHPEQGLILPDEFIPFAEECGLIIQIDDWVISRAFNTLQGWHQSGLVSGKLSMSVNISGQTLEDSSLLSRINTVLEETGLDPSNIILEIVERAILEDSKASKEVLGEFKKIGINIHLDDFGSGHSALNILRDLPIDVIKIDRSFIENLNNNVEKSEIVKAIVSLGNGLDKKVIAEGIETLGEVEFLQKINCQMGQGYHFYKPVAEEEIREFLEIPN